MLARLCFGQLSITGKDSRAMFKRATHAQNIRACVLINVSAPYADINSISYVFSRAPKRGRGERQQDIVVGRCH